MARPAFMGRWSSSTDAVRPTPTCENPRPAIECPANVRCLWGQRTTNTRKLVYFICPHSNQPGPHGSEAYYTHLWGRAPQYRLHSCHTQFKALQSVGWEWLFHLSVFPSFPGPGVSSLGMCKNKWLQKAHSNVAQAERLRPSFITFHRIRFISKKPITCSRVSKWCSFLS